MKFNYILLSSFLLLTSCSLTDMNPSGEIIFPTPSLSGNTSITGAQNSTGSISNTGYVQQATVGANETKYIILDVKNNVGALKINYGTGARVRVQFISDGSKKLTVKVGTPRDPKGNIRISQIIFPDGSADGPFGQDLSQALVQSGSYQIILSPNMMAGDPWSGEVDLSLELK